MTKIIHYDDIGYSVDCEVCEYHVKFTVHGIAGYLQPTNERSYERAPGSEWTENLAEARADFSGTVKWDGCSNWNFPRDSCLHFCTKKSAIDLGVLLGRLYDVAKEELPNADF